MKLTFDYIRKHGLLLYEYIRGSHCHGINTPESDVDTGGVFILPNETRLGLGLDYVPFIEDETHDTVWYELNRFAELLIKSNPTVLESLFVDDKYVLYEHPIFAEFRKRRNMFVTKERHIGMYLVGNHDNVVLVAEMGKSLQCLLRPADAGRIVGIA